MCQTGSRKIAADGIDIDQLYYLNAEYHFWVLIYTSMERASFYSCLLLLNFLAKEKLKARLSKTTYNTTHILVCFVIC